MTEYKLGDYVRIHDHDGAEITVKITDSGVPSRYSDFMFKAGSRMFKNSEILGLGDVPVVSEKRAFAVGERVQTIDRLVGTIDHISGHSVPYRVDFGDGRMGWYGERELHAESISPPDTEVHADLVSENEAVKHPAHYGGADDPYEAIKVIEAWDLNFNLGSVLKYVRRAGKKDASKELEDLRKARFYIDHEISRVEKS